MERHNKPLKVPPGRGRTLGGAKLTDPGPWPMGVYFRIPFSFIMCFFNSYCDSIMIMIIMTNYFRVILLGFRLLFALA